VKNVLTEAKLYAAPPSHMLRILKALVNHGLLRRGYGWLLLHLPARLWGGKNIWVKTEVGRMVVPLGEASSVPLIVFGTDPSEPMEIQLIRRLSPIFLTSLDIGAHFGWYSRLILIDGSVDKRVYSFEPDPTSFVYLRENLREHANAWCFPSAIIDQDRLVDFYCNPGHSNLSSATRLVAKQPVLVDGLSLDTFCKAKQLIGNIDFIKCDVEGGELNVLRGAREVRSVSNPPIWQLEVIDEFLVEAGSSVAELSQEIEACGRVFLYCPQLDGSPQPIDNVSQRSGTNNVFVVPEVRNEAFVKAAGVY
jgi:FkbM family methyltransferase